MQDTASWYGLSSPKVLGVRLTIRRHFLFLHSRQDLVYKTEIIVSTCERTVPVHPNRADGKFDNSHLGGRFQEM